MLAQSRYQSIGDTIVQLYIYHDFGLITPVHRIQRGPVNQEWEDRDENTDGTHIA